MEEISSCFDLFSIELKHESQVKPPFNELVLDVHRVSDLVIDLLP